MRVALVHDYLNQSGGAEVVLRWIHHIFPDAPIYTLIYDP
ncbi:MAG TPA: glycosyltransferase family 4 protein, partial [candidate division Zixibacteria bacterium]|nr:glycosyltransferase family 4 protein [candidate division Zixibacteria bacterium]